MDEGHYKATFREVNERPCPFAKAILSHCCACSRARKLLLAEREAIACLSPAGHARCSALHHLLREKALFALHLTPGSGELPHAKEMKVQCGGLLGLRAALEGDGAESGPVADADALVEEALARHGDLDTLPYGEIIKEITGYQPRRRGGRY